MIDKDNINVLNYNDNPVCTASHLRGYLFGPAQGGAPSLIPMTLPEIEYINANSGAFKLGILRFEPDKEAELYEKLKIADWKDILTNAQIEDILLHPTLAGLQRLLAIENAALFERVRSLFFSLKNANADISTRVEKLIEARYRELRNRQYKTAIVLTPKDAPLPAPQVDELMQQNAAMQAQIAQMQKMLETLGAQQAKKAEESKTPSAKKQPARSTGKQAE